MALKVSDEKGNVYFGTFGRKAGKWIFEKSIAGGKIVPQADTTLITGDRLVILSSVCPKIALSTRDTSGIKTYIPVLIIERFVIPSTIMNIEAGDAAGSGVYKLTYIAKVFPAVPQWVLTKTSDFEMGVGFFEISPVKQEQNCFSGNILEFSPVGGHTKVTLSYEDIAGGRTKPIFTIEQAAMIDINYLL